MFTPLTNPMPTPVFHPDKFREQFSQALRVQGKAKKTAKIYSDAVIAFHDFAQVHPLFAKANDIRAFLYYLLREKKYAPRTFNQNLYGLKAFYGTYMPEIPIMAEFRRHKTNRRLVTVLSEGQVADMLEVCDNIKHQVMIALLYGTGIRVGECAGLTIVDFDKNEMLLHVVGKGEKDRYVMIPGSLLPDRKSWINCRDNFLFPVAVMRTLFKGKFMDMFYRGVESGKIALHGTLGMYENPAIFEQLVRDLHDKDWVVYAKRPFATPENLIKYLGSYTHRVAISNRRIVKIENGAVTFRYKDRRDHNRIKNMTLGIVEFIRRFMTHVVPKGFMRMRHIGIFSNRNRAELVALCKRLLDGPGVKESSQKRCQDIIESLTQKDPLCCPHCKKGRLHIIERIEPVMPLMRAA
jgi:hypothetical protein